MLTLPQVYITILLKTWVHAAKIVRVRLLRVCVRSSRWIPYTFRIILRTKFFALDIETNPSDSVGAFLTMCTHTYPFARTTAIFAAYTIRVSKFARNTLM